MKIQSVIALVTFIATVLVAGCIDHDTEQTCVSDEDCLDSRICTTAGACAWPEDSEEERRVDAGVSAPDSELPTDPRPPIDGGHEPDATEDATEDASEDATENVECPEALPRARVQGGQWQTDSLTTIPLETVEFDASPSTGDIVRYEWTIIERPEGSTQRLVPASSVENPRLFLDLAGIYVIQLRVLTEEYAGESCATTATIEIDACPCDNDIHIQLTWETPADPDQTDNNGTDLDLHYLHPNGRWNEAPWDIYFRNPTADWNDNGNGPSLDIDDTDGAGPENINHSGPDNLTYRTGVYYYSDRGLGGSYATVRIYVRGQLEYEYKAKHLEENGTFWDVATISWPSGDIAPTGHITMGFP